MSRQTAERLGSIFLAVFSTGLAAQLAADGMKPVQWIGAAVAVAGSLALMWAVRAWPEPQRAPTRD